MEPIEDPLRILAYFTASSDDSPRSTNSSIVKNVVSILGQEVEDPEFPDEILSEILETALLKTQDGSTIRAS